MNQNVNKNALLNLQPLATRMRPRTLEEFIGQSQLLSSGKPLAIAISQGILHSMILWGPPGTGKTTLAQLLASKTAASFMRLSAISSGVKDIREVVTAAQKLRAEGGRATILFIDEVHRFNKAQQDSLLPYVEDGTFILIGATTENPSFELNSALLSRARVYVLKRLNAAELMTVLSQAIQDKERGLGHIQFDFPDDLRQILIQAADGDARQALNLLEILGDLTVENKIQVTKDLLTEVIQHQWRRFDKKGEAFYDQISALHKSVRGSSPDAALYWFARMIDGGCDPLYIGRRVIRMASEDIGNADPRGLQIALDGYAAYERLGSPEGELALAQAIVYLACAPKSNAVYTALGQAMHDIKVYGSLEIPLKLRNAPTSLMKHLNYGQNYIYAHDEPGAYVPGESYFPEHFTRQYYFPTDRGLETKIKEKLEYLKSLDVKKSLSAE